MNESFAFNQEVTYTRSPDIQHAPGIPCLCLLCWNCKWPPCLFSFQWILSTLALVLTLAQGLYPLSQLPVPHILMFYIAIMLDFISFLRYLSLRETLHCTDVSRQWCAYRYVGNKSNTKKFSKINKNRSHSAAAWPQPCSPCRSTMHRMKLFMNVSKKVERNRVH